MLGFLKHINRYLLLGRGSRKVEEDRVTLCGFSVFLQCSEKDGMVRRLPSQKDIRLVPWGVIHFDPLVLDPWPDITLVDAGCSHHDLFGSVSKS